MVGGETRVSDASNYKRRCWPEGAQARGRTRTGWSFPAQPLCIWIA